MWNGKCGLLVVALICLFLLPVGAKAKIEMDVEMLLEKVHKARRPSENMRIEWIYERTSVGKTPFRKPPPAEERISLTKSKGQNLRDLL